MQSPGRIAICTVFLFTTSLTGCGPRQPTAESTSATAPAPAVQQSPTPENEAPVEAADASHDSSNAEVPSLVIPTEPSTEVATPRRRQAIPHVEPLSAAEAPLPLDLVPTERLTTPVVALSEQHARLCQVRQGDRFPIVDLPTITGEPQKLDNLLGNKLTLVLWWNSQEPSGQEALRDVTRYYLPRFDEQGLAAIAIHSGTLSPTFQAEFGDLAFPVLQDATGEALRQVGTGRIPRIYLLDAAGTIVWFDIEYSTTTRRDLATMIRLALAE